MRLIIIIILFLSCISNRGIYEKNAKINKTTTQVVNDSIIQWRYDYKLSWRDFEGKAPIEYIGIKKAETCSEIIIEGEFFEGELPEFKVLNFFHKKESWTITSGNDMLAHEQGHFDIAEIFSRKIRKRFVELQKKKELNSNEYITEYHRLRKECRLHHVKYDSEVYFNEENQQQWYVDIANQLEELKEYQYKE